MGAHAPSAPGSSAYGGVFTATVNSRNDTSLSVSSLLSVLKAPRLSDLSRKHTYHTILRHPLVERESVEVTRLMVPQMSDSGCCEELSIKKQCKII